MPRRPLFDSSEETVRQGRSAALLTYIPFIIGGILAYLILKKNTNSFARYHARLALTAHIGMLALWIILLPIHFFLGWLGQPGLILASLIWSAWIILYCAITVIGVKAVWEISEDPLPIISDAADLILPR